jgi:hypothetical protein
VRVVLGAGAALLLTAGLVLARTFRRPFGTDRAPGDVAPTVVSIEGFSARWYTRTTGW